MADGALSVEYQRVWMDVNKHPLWVIDERSKTRSFDAVRCAGAAGCCRLYVIMVSMDTEEYPDGRQYASR